MLLRTGWKSRSMFDAASNVGSVLKNCASTCTWRKTRRKQSPQKGETANGRKDEARRVIVPAGRERWKKGLTAGWYPRRRGILEHLDSGLVSLLDCAVHDFLCLTCYYSTGVAMACAEKIRALSPREVTLRAIQRSLAHLESIGWIKRFRAPNQKGNYPILIHRWFVRVGCQNESTVTRNGVGLSPETKGSVTRWVATNAERTTDWRNVQFDPVTQDEFSLYSAVTRNAGDLSPLKEVRSKNEELTDRQTAQSNQNPIARAPPPPSILTTSSPNNTLPP